MSCGTCAQQTKQATATATAAPVSAGIQFSPKKCPSCGWFLPKHGTCVNTKCSGVPLSVGGYADAQNQLLQKKKIPAGIRKRWGSRILAQGLHRRGAAGARDYLTRYGRNIGAPKCVNLARVAEANGYPDMAVGFWQKAYEIEFGIPAWRAPPDSPQPIGARSPGTNVAPATQKTATAIMPALPAEFQPGQFGTMQPVIAKQDRQHYIDNDNFLGQPKRNGERRVVFVTANDVKGQTRSNNLRSLPTTEMVDALKEVADTLGSFVLDGEMWWRAEDGSEHQNAARATARNTEIGNPSANPVPQYTVFQAVYGDRTNLMFTDADNRIHAAEKYVEALHKKAGGAAFEMSPTARTRKEKQELVDKQQREGREGEVWYNKNRLYTSGKTGGVRSPLVKTRYRASYDVIVTGWKPSRSANRPFASLQVRAYDDKDSLIPMGSIGTGFTQQEMEEILEAFETEDNLVITVEGDSVTEKNRILQGSYQGIRRDKDHSECLLADYK